MELIIYCIVYFSAVAFLVGVIIYVIKDVLDDFKD